MSTVTDIVGAIEKSTTFTNRQIREAADCVVASGLVRPGRRGLGAEPRTAQEAAAIALGVFGSRSPTHAGRNAKRFFTLPWRHGSMIDQAAFDGDCATRKAVARLKGLIARPTFGECLTAMLESARELDAALADVTARATDAQLRTLANWQPARLKIVLNLDDELAVGEVRIAVEEAPTIDAALTFNAGGRILFSIFASFADRVDDERETGDALRRIVDQRVILALANSLTGKGQTIARRAIDAEA